MSRLSRINTIWRKELKDTLRDLRTLAAMVLLPMVLYPALMIGSLQAVEMQVSFLVTEKYSVGVPNAATQAWLRGVIDDDARFLKQLVQDEAASQSSGGPRRGAEQSARAGVREAPPEFQIHVLDDVPAAILAGAVHVGLAFQGPPPQPGEVGSAAAAILYDDAEIRSQIASAGLSGVLERTNSRLLEARLRSRGLSVQFIAPLAIHEQNIAPSERLAGSVLGQIVPLVLILMTITGAIYPAIDLTAGERERGTLETLMVAPVPALDLIAGKFVVVTLIGLLSAALNLASIGGTIYLAGVGTLFSQSETLQFPFHALPWILLLMTPLAVLFSATLLAVCSFARSFKEAQNYVVPVMMAALIPGVVGILPGTRLDGPILIMPVANIVVLARDLFLDRFDADAILLVLLSTCLYAGAAVAVAAKLFGQEAVLFADSGSVATIFDRRFFTPRETPSTAAALLVLVVIYTLNFYLQQAISSSPRLASGLPYLNAVALTLIVLLGFGPWFAARYMKITPTTAFQLRVPPTRAFLAAVCFGGSTWLLVGAWWRWQQTWLPLPPDIENALVEQTRWMSSVPWVASLFYLALVPALTEEVFFRGYVLSGVRSGAGKWTALLVVALAFGLFHYSVFRLGMTVGLGVLLGLLAVQFRSIWPCVLAHAMHNGIVLMSSRDDGLRPLLAWLGYGDAEAGAPVSWVIGAAVACGVGIAICLAWQDRLHPRCAPAPVAGDSAWTGAKEPAS